MIKAHTDITKTMKDMYMHFANDDRNVQHQWALFTRSVDTKIEDALRQTVKRSLQELSRAITGDAKQEPQPLFKVNVVLENNRVEFQPTMIRLTQSVNIVSKDVITAISEIRRLEQLLPEEIDGYRGGSDLDINERASFYDIISNDEGILEILVQIMNGMSSSATELQKNFSQWDKYKPLWDMDKDAYIRRYAKAKRPLHMYNIDIQRYRDQQEDIQSDEHTQTIDFIKIDVSILKATLVRHCVQWQNQLTGLLNSVAREELVKLVNDMRDNTEELSTKPNNIDELARKLNLLQSLDTSKEDIEASFEPLEAKYATLTKFDVQISEEEQAMLANLHANWTTFKGLLEKSAKALAKNKIQMKKTLEDSLDNFTKFVKDSRKEAKAALPYSGDISIDDARKVLETYAGKLESTREKQRALKPGLDIFEIEPPTYKEIRDTENDLKLLNKIWDITAEWHAKWQEWKGMVFASIETSSMQIVAAQFKKSLVKIKRDINQITKIPWKVVDSMEQRIVQFMATLPLIMNLKNPAMRQRHWDQLKDEIHKTFDAHAADFTLEKVFDLGLHLHDQFIGELSSNANKELAIEEALANIDQVWDEQVIDLVEYKEVYFKIRSTEDLFNQLEDNQVQLSTMKASRFYLSFEEGIQFWEKTLSHIMEVMELSLSVQRQWMYLESIFMSSEDIRKQLPGETKLFDQVNESFKSVMETMVANPNAKEACGAEGMLEKLNEMDQKLETIQKSLDQYLETKRQFFARFYFLSNDDLLEILGQQKDPEQVQKHIKKCFIGINTLKLIPPMQRGNRTIQCIGFNSAKGEFCEAAESIEVDGPVERWLLEVESVMVKSVKKFTGGAAANLRTKKEKWVQEWQGQALITVGKIEWTRECTKALEAVAKGNSKALRQLKKKQVGLIGRLSDMIRMPDVTKLTRRKLQACITMELHSRDVQERMIKAGCSKPSDFDWMSQLRYYWEKPADGEEYGRCDTRQTNCSLEYGYEYQGNNGRLVVTPLTDRCVLTLTTALYLQRGGSPLGPAGTGKTETVKDLGKNLAK